MRVLLLGGQNSRHAAWVREFATHLENGGFPTTFVDYANWGSGESKTNVPHELDVVAAIAKGLGDFIVVGKSIGSVIAIEGAGRGLLSPKGALLLGFPLTDILHDAEIRGAAGLLPPTIVVQNESDPFGSFADVSEFFAEFGPSQCRVEEVPGRSDHDYEQYSRLVALVSEVSEGLD